ncbi:MAG: DUF1847 domain-containing protein [Anaeromyxobacteraceae bacterium]
MADDSPTSPSCASCAAVWDKKGTTNCWADPSNAPPAPGNCPTRAHAETVAGTLPRYLDGGDDARMARVAATVEGLCYQKAEGGAVHARWTRVEDTIAFAKLMGYRRLGIATCIGLLEESRRLAEILTAQGLEPVSVCCKVGSVDKAAALGIPEAEKVRPGTFEPACNPVAQAEILNGLATDLNVLVGLCVGHDALFNKHSKAPVTTLVVKDRVTGHNPVAVLYGQGFYFKRLQKAPLVIPER